VHSVRWAFLGVRMDALLVDEIWNMQYGMRGFVVILLLVVISVQVLFLGSNKGWSV
jgi:hypothetical protein